MQELLKLLTELLKLLRLERLGNSRVRLIAFLVALGVVTVRDTCGVYYRCGFVVAQCLRVCPRPPFSPPYSLFNLRASRLPFPLRLGTDPFANLHQSALILCCFVFPLPTGNTKQKCGSGIPSVHAVPFVCCEQPRVSH